MGNTSKFITWAAAGLLVAGLCLVLLLVLADSARAPSVEPLTPAAVDAALSPPPVAETPAVATPAPIAPEDIAPAELLATADELQAQYESRKAEMPEEVAKPLDDDIGIIEGAAADLLAAIASEPDNNSLKNMLIATYRNEVKLLKKALHLTGDSADEPEAAEVPEP